MLLNKLGLSGLPMSLYNNTIAAGQSMKACSHQVEWPGHLHCLSVYNSRAEVIAHCSESSSNENMT